MQRDLKRLADERFDLLVIGGGIAGACIARDAARRGLSVALIEKDDFAHATSAHNSKLIHGGLRYLRNFELGLVRESLKERRVWQRIAPHLVSPLGFLIPMFDGRLKTRAALLAGLSLYDLLSFDRSWLDDPAQRLPRHAQLDRAAARNREPVLDDPRLSGAFRYHDAQMYAPERLALECVIDAFANGAAPANHLEATGLLLRSGRVEGAEVRDTLSQATFDVRARLVVVAAGPWADLFLSRALSKPASHPLLRSKGIHLIVPAIVRTHALTVATGRGHFFVLPWRCHSLLGTTDSEFDGAPDQVGVTESDIAAFLSLINANLPSAGVRREQVLHFYAGLRPLVDDGSRDTYGTSRRAELIDHGEEEGICGLLSVIGGKWTTSRRLAEKTLDVAVRKLNIRARPCSTAGTPLPGGRIANIADFMASARATEFPNGAHIARLYGTRLPAILELARARPELRASLSRSGDIGAQILLAAREEMALTLEDAVMRRTGIGQLGHPGDQAIDAAAALLAAERGWSESRKRAEIGAVVLNFRLQGTPS